MPKQIKEEDRKEGKKRGRRKRKHLCIYKYKIHFVIKIYSQIHENKF